MIDWNILFTIIKNVRSFHLNTDLIGLTLEQSCISISKKESIDFALVTNDTNLMFYKKENVIPPFYLSKLIFPLIKKILCHKDLGMNMVRTVLAEQEIIWHDMVRIGDRLEVAACIHDIYETDRGEMIKIKITIYHDFRLIIEGSLGFIIRNRKKVKREIMKEQQSGKKMFQTEIQTYKGQQLKFAQVSGDYNFIHMNRLFARIAGLPDVIMHGACVIAMICSALVENKLKNDLRKLRSISGRFSKPVIPGEKLILTGYTVPDPYTIHFEVFNPAGIAVFKKGIFRFRD